MKDARGYIEGDKSKAICNKCAKIVDTTLKLRPIGCFKDGAARLDALCFACDICGTVVSFPHQDANKIKIKSEGL